MLDEAHAIPEFDRMAIHQGAGEPEGGLIVPCWKRIGAQDLTVRIEDKCTIAVRQPVVRLDRAIQRVVQHLLTLINGER
ncbi:hypothetical protein LDDCCGHA_6140 [Methylobacterium oxalidis]|nr:hypothetical protein LDDCCGHA_6140 [Methylobacterium oxalidis]